MCIEVTYEHVRPFIFIWCLLLDRQPETFLHSQLKALNALKNDLECHPNASHMTTVYHRRHEKPNFAPFCLLWRGFWYYKYYFGAKRRAWGGIL